MVSLANSSTAHGAAAGSGLLRLVQSKSTREYLAHDARWVKHPEQAHHFPDLASAAVFCRKAGIVSDVHVVLVMDRVHVPIEVFPPNR